MFAATTTATVTTTTVLALVRELLYKLGGYDFISDFVFVAHIAVLGESGTANFLMELELSGVTVEVTSGATCWMNFQATPLEGGWKEEFPCAGVGVRDGKRDGSREAAARWADGIWPEGPLL